MRAHLLGESAIFVDLELEGDPRRATKTLAAARAAHAHLPEADVVVGAGTLAIVGVGPFEEADDAIAAAARAARDATSGDDDAEEIRIPVRYDGEDLDAVAAASGLTRDQVVEAHAGQTYTAELVGFLPGFAYLGPVEPRLALPRRASPRPRVPARSVAIAGGFTGVYPSTSPGGWHLLGRALGPPPFDPDRARPLLVSPGMRVRFVPTDDDERARTPDARAEEAAPARALIVVRAPALATVQDGGRAGRLAMGLPPSGPLDPSAMTSASFAVGNTPDDAAVEIPRGTLVVRARGRLRVSVDGAPASVIEDGDEMTIPEVTRAVRYLAIAGGVDVPEVLGARATLVATALGGFRGRPLRAGDVVPLRADHGCAARTTIEPPPDPLPVATLHVTPGPHAALVGDEAIAALTSAELTVSPVGDRTGVRLAGAPARALPALALPVPMVRGAIELTPDGTPIVLGPDHPTTGGYPIALVLQRASQARLARLRPGHRVRLVLG